MAHAAFELGVQLYAVAIRCENLSTATRPFAGDLRKAAALCERVFAEANSERRITDGQLEALSVLFQKMALKLCELIELVRELYEANTVAGGVIVSHAREKVARIASLMTDCAVILDLRLT